VFVDTLQKELLARQGKQTKVRAHLCSCDCRITCSRHGGGVSSAMNYLLQVWGKRRAAVRSANYLLSLGARHLFHFPQMNYLQPSPWERF